MRKLRIGRANGVYALREKEVRKKISNRFSSIIQVSQFSLLLDSTAMASKLLMGAIRYPNRFFNATGKFFSYRPMSNTPPSSPLGNGKTVDEKSQHKLSLNDDELAKFSAIADTWSFSFLRFSVPQFVFYLLYIFIFSCIFFCYLCFDSI